MRQMPGTFGSKFSITFPIKSWIFYKLPAVALDAERILNRTNCNETNQCEDAKEVLDNLNELLGGDDRTKELLTNPQLLTYIELSPICIFLCILAIIINLRILFSIKWIRRPLSPTLFISLSLTFADTCSTFFILLDVIINGLLPKHFNIKGNNKCVLLALEALRLSGILVSTIHLLILAINHYLGIVFPLRAIVLLKRKNLKRALIITWVLPTLYIFGYFISFEYQVSESPACQVDIAKNFFYHSRFRSIFSAIFFMPMLIMFGIYIHILVIVRRNQTNREWCNQTPRRSQSTGGESQRQPEKSLKALETSLLILSTYVICFMPIVIHFYLICNDCHFKFKDVGLQGLTISWTITQILFILKYIVNPLIYPLRMQEIDLAIGQMTAALVRKVNCFRNTDDLGFGMRENHRLIRFRLPFRRRNAANTSNRIRNRAYRSSHIMESEL